ncbi:MAG TPA: amidase family protein [Solirubrobacteraceae bacterium]|nr:amidase family protein [Solirubrobacteraceae bacterium]
MQATEEPLSWAATRLAAAIRSREISSRELLELELERVKEQNPRVNAVVTIDEDGAGAAARRADELTARGGSLPPLHGLPVTIKDAIETAGMRSTGGAIELTDHVPTDDAPSVARLKQAGAIVFGKTNVPRWSEDMQTYNAIFGTTNNPHDVQRTAGGSSGGAAAAVATGMTAFELGTDIGGSIRIPSHFCGVCGHKPSFGVVSQRGYLGYLGSGGTDSDLNVFGPLARTVGDLELLMDVLVGPDVELATAWTLRLPPARHAELADYRIGVWIDDPDGELDIEVRALLHHAVAALGDAGAQVSDSRPALGLAESDEVFWPLVLGAASPRLPDDVAVEVGGPHARWIRHRDRAAELRRRWREWFATHDVLLCPVMPVPAFPHDLAGTFSDRSLAINGQPVPHARTLPWIGLIGVAYLPATVVPVGRTASGLPVGIQVVGPYLEDRTALFVARHLAQLLAPAGTD